MASRGNLPSNYWRSRGMCHTEYPHLRDGACGSFVVLYDHTAQDEVVADLLTSHFTHDDQLGKRDVVLVV